MKQFEIYNMLQDYISDFKDWCIGKTDAIHKFTDAWGLPNSLSIYGMFDLEAEPKFIDLEITFQANNGTSFSCDVVFVSDGIPLMNFNVHGNPETLSVTDEFNIRIQNIHRLEGV
jgi:hypothetical protein